MASCMFGTGVRGNTADLLAAAASGALNLLRSPGGIRVGGVERAHDRRGAPAVVLWGGLAPVNGLNHVKNGQRGIITSLRGFASSPRDRAPLFGNEAGARECLCRGKRRKSTTSPGSATVLAFCRRAATEIFWKPSFSVLSNRTPDWSRGLRGPADCSPPYRSLPGVLLGQSNLLTGAPRCFRAVLAGVVVL